MRHVVPELVFLLVARDGERGDGSGELIVAKGFAAGGSEKICGEGEVESFADGGIASLGVTEAAGRERERTDGGRSELELLIEQDAVVVRSGGGAGGGQSALLQQIILSMVAFERAAEKPLCARGLRPIQPGGKERLAVRLGNRRGYSADGADIRKRSVCGELREAIELRKGISAVGHAGVFVDV